MRVRFLGTGTSTGNPEIGCRCKVCNSADDRDYRLRSSALVDVNNQSVLIDCGPDVRMQMLETFKLYPFEPLSGVLITHEHYDHVGGLDDLRSFCKKKAVDIYAEEYVADAIKRRIPYVFASQKYPGIPNLDLHVIDGNPFLLKGVEIIPVRLLHGRLPIFGYRIQNMAYLTDLKFIPEEEFDKLKDLDVLIINALREEEHISHQTLESALNYIQRIKPKQAYLIHMNHHFGLHAEMEKRMPENVMIAYDGLEISC